jgi:hypothetical protein
MAKVVRFHELGGPEVLRLEEITFEDSAPGELRLKVGAIGYCGWLILERRTSSRRHQANPGGDSVAPYSYLVSCGI